MQADLQDSRAANQRGGFADSFRRPSRKVAGLRLSRSGGTGAVVICTDKGSLQSEASRALGTAASFGNGRWLRSPLPVSYTHLDVYKRQE